MIMQYTGHRKYSEADPPTYACVGTSDGIANWRTMQARLQAMSALGIPTEFHAYEELPHGFGLGAGTTAEGCGGFLAGTAGQRGRRCAIKLPGQIFCAAKMRVRFYPSP